jgi:hypothetical protein
MKRIESSLVRMGDSGQRRVIYFRFEGDSGYLFVRNGQDDIMLFSDCFRTGGSDVFRVPKYMVAAFEAGEPIEPILDYLLEHYADTHPWLPEAVRRVCGAEGVGA